MNDGRAFWRLASVGKWLFLGLLVIVVLGTMSQMIAQRWGRLAYLTGQTGPIEEIRSSSGTSYRFTLWTEDGTGHVLELRNGGKVWQMLSRLSVESVVEVGHRNGQAVELTWLNPAGTTAHEFSTPLIVPLIAVFLSLVLGVILLRPGLFERFTS